MAGCDCSLNITPPEECAVAPENYIFLLSQLLLASSEIVLAIGLPDANTDGAPIIFCTGNSQKTSNVCITNSPKIASGTVQPP